MGDTGYLTLIAESNGNFYARDNKMEIPRFFHISAEENKLIPISKIPTFPKDNSYQNLPPKDQLPNLSNSVPKESYVVVTRGEGLFLLSDLGLDLGNFVVTDTAYYVEYQYKLFRWKIGSLNWYDTGVTDIDDARKGSKPGVSNSKNFKLAVSGKTVYVGKRDGHLMQSFDGGDIWNDVTANLPFSVERFHAITFAGQSVYVATDKGVARSSNGTDWQILTDTEGAPLVVDRFAVDGTTMYGTSQRKVYQLKAGSDVWHQVTPEILYPVTCLDVDGNTLYVGTFGRGVLRFALEE